MYRFGKSRKGPINGILIPSIASMALSFQGYIFGYEEIYMVLSMKLLLHQCYFTSLDNPFSSQHINILVFVTSDRKSVVTNTRRLIVFWNR